MAPSPTKRSSFPLHALLARIARSPPLVASSTQEMSAIDHSGSAASSCASRRSTAATWHFIIQSRMLHASPLVTATHKPRASCRADLTRSSTRGRCPLQARPHHLLCTRRAIMAQAPFTAMGPNLTTPSSSGRRLRNSGLARHGIGFARRQARALRGAADQARACRAAQSHVRSPVCDVDARGAARRARRRPLYYECEVHQDRTVMKDVTNTKHEGAVRLERLRRKGWLRSRCLLFWCALSVANAKSMPVSRLSWIRTKRFWDAVRGLRRSALCAMPF